jgi:hypothetical protein
VTFSTPGDLHRRSAMNTRVEHVAPDLQQIAGGDDAAAFTWSRPSAGNAARVDEQDVPHVGVHERSGG